MAAHKLNLLTEFRISARVSGFEGSKHALKRPISSGGARHAGDFCSNGEGTPIWNPRFCCSVARGRLLKVCRDLSGCVLGLVQMSKNPNPLNPETPKPPPPPPLAVASGCPQGSTWCAGCAEPNADQTGCKKWGGGVGIGDGGLGFRVRFLEFWAENTDS